MDRIAVIAVTYNRPDSLTRLIKSLQSASYGDDSVDLIISIDKNPEMEQKIIELANNYDWPYGNKQVRTFNERQGLRDHILQCGDFTNDYDAVIVLEDDLIVAENYYNYSKQALKFYENDDRISGISLYSHKKNFNNGLPFIPLKDFSDVFFIQCAQSWGQCWGKKMWSSFRKWYQSNNQVINQTHKLPRKISNWPATSWLKYYMNYIVETNKFFVYPYDSLTTNSTDVGQHNISSSDDFHVPLLFGQKEYNFTTLDDGIVYDIFFENYKIANLIGGNINQENLCVDLYCTKHSNAGKKYLLTRRHIDFKIIQTYGLHLKPHEFNIIYKIQGKDIFLYDIGDNIETDLKGKFDIIKESKYYSATPWKQSLISGFFSVVSGLQYKMNKIRKRLV
jgi:hypothetical protein